MITGEEKSIQWRGRTLNAWDGGPGWVAVGAR